LESLFVPVAIIGEGSQLCVSKIGFMDASGRDLTPPLDSCHASMRSVIEGLLHVLQVTQHPIPIYLQSLADHVLAASSTVTSERCAWFGFNDVVPSECEFKTLTGVHSVRFGTLSDHDDCQVVEVKYDSKASSFNALVLYMLTRLPSQQIIVYCQSNDERMAARVEITKLSDLGMYNRQVAIVFVGNNDTFKPTMDRSAIQQTPMRFVPLTEDQATRANIFFLDGQYDKATNLLSPRQMRFLVAAVQSGSCDFYDVTGYPILDAWISNVEKTPPKRRPCENRWQEETEPEVYCL
jgi:hypothetical protein